MTTDATAVLSEKLPVASAAPRHCDPEMRESLLGRILFRASQFQRLTAWCLRQALRWEGGEFYSVTARRIMLSRYGVNVGAYSHGSCFDPVGFGSGTIVGRYVSIAQRVRAFQANHPTNRLSMHAFFFNSELGYVRETNLPVTVLTIEHDAWLGDAVIITPGCRRIGLGAVVGAGSIVTKDVPDFAIVAGNPARLIRWRFPADIQERIRNSRWWELPVSECARHIDAMARPLDNDAASHPLLRRCEGSQFSS